MAPSSVGTARIITCKHVTLTDNAHNMKQLSETQKPLDWLHWSPGLVDTQLHKRDRERQREGYTDGHRETTIQSTHNAFLSRLSVSEPIVIATYSLACINAVGPNSLSRSRFGALSNTLSADNARRHSCAPPSATTQTWHSADRPITIF